MAHLIYSVLPYPRRAIIFVEPELSVESCVELMIAQNIGALVVRDGNKLIGMVTERDVVRKCVHQNLDSRQTTAGDIAYEDVSILQSNDPVEKAMETITMTKRRHVLVADDGELIAILSIGDLLFHMLDDKSRVIQHLENYIHS